MGNNHVVEAIVESCKIIDIIEAIGVGALEWCLSRMDGRLESESME
jgi:hypothetical protein